MNTCLSFASPVSHLELFKYLLTYIFKALTGKYVFTLIMTQLNGFMIFLSSYKTGFGGL